MNNTFQNLTAHALSRLSNKYEVRRTPFGAYDEHGRWNSRKAECFEICAVIQPSTPEEMKDLPENRRSRAGVSIWTDQRLHTVSTAESKQPDRIVYLDREWEIVQVADWSEIAGFFKALATRVDECL